MMGVGAGCGAGLERSGGGPPPYPTLLPNLVAQWKMNDASGANIADSIGSYTLTQAGTVGSAAGKIGNCRTFNGTTQYGVVAADATIAGVNSSFTWSTWVYLTGGDRIINIRNGGNFCFDLRYSAGDIVAFLGNGAGGFTSGYTVAVAPATATWHHVVVAYNVAADKIKTSFNGVVSAEATPATHPTNLGGTSLGFMNDGTGVLLAAGRLDCTKMWSRYLPDTDIAIDYNGGLGVEL